LSPPAVEIAYLRDADAPSEEESLLQAAAGRLGARFRVETASSAAERGAVVADRVVLIGPRDRLPAFAGGLPAASLVAILDTGADPDGLSGEAHGVSAFLRRPLNAGGILVALRLAVAHAGLLSELHSLRRQAADQGRELKELNSIGVALSAERDLDTLLQLILTKCREITSADAGSLYLVERDDTKVHVEREYFADKLLVFRLTQNDSVSVPFRRTTMEVSRRSLAGFVALMGEPLHIEDAYAIPEEAEYRFNPAFDMASGYRTRSLLVIPMLNHKLEVIGVLQLINRKRERAARLTRSEEIAAQVIPFDSRTTEMARSLASQAAVAIENARLYEEIQNLFEGFIRASVTAIESRDPTTSGHSERVADLTVGLAELVDRQSTGPFRSTYFARSDIREIRYASLLHDFGKIGVRENVLVKGKKLYDHELKAIEDRFRLVRRTLQLSYARRKIRDLLEKSREEALAAAIELDGEQEARLAELDRYFMSVVQANEPTVLAEEGSALLRLVAGVSVEGLEGEESTRLLLPWEFANLSIPKGSLSPGERLQIESHVTHTFHFLATIPWTRELRQVPEIAYAHHEKLDGSGYPRGVRSTEISIESRMMAISDIYDALTAKDRPYKRSIPVERALDILAAEVREEKLDADLFRLFTEGKVYESVVAARPPRPG
jgi:HD-GYP domain-containing protein (c-di-GMP phosphodiesterase class II)